MLVIVAAILTVSIFSDSMRRRQCFVVAIDALYFSDPIQQYDVSRIDRELNKAFTGFSALPDITAMAHLGIATGNWGCGAFRGDPELKSWFHHCCGSL